MVGVCWRQGTQGNQVVGQLEGRVELEISFRAYGLYCTRGPKETKRNRGPIREYVKVLLFDVRLKNMFEEDKLFNFLVWITDLGQNSREPSLRI